MESPIMAGFWFLGFLHKFKHSQSILLRSFEQEKCSCWITHSSCLVVWYLTGRYVVCSRKKDISISMAKVVLQFYKIHFNFLLRSLYFPPSYIITQWSRTIEDIFINMKLLVGILDDTNDFQSRWFQLSTFLSYSFGTFVYLWGCKSIDLILLIYISWMIERLFPTALHDARLPNI